MSVFDPLETLRIRGDKPTEMDDALAALERLARLRDAGTLTEEEFISEKGRILARHSEQRPARKEHVPSRHQSASWMRSRRGRAIAVTAILLLAAAAGSWWWFSPYWTLRNMQAAVKARDAEAFSRYVDFASLRADLKADAFAKIAKEAKTSKGDTSDGFAMLGAAMVGPIIDGVISPDGVHALFAMKVPDDDFGLLDAASGGGKVIRTGLSEFKVEGANGDVLIFTLSGFNWRLSGMDEAPVRTSPAPRPASAATTKQTPTTALAPSACSGFYSYIPRHIQTEVAFSVEVQPSAVNVLFTDYSNMFGRKSMKSDGTVIFQEPSGPENSLTCQGETAVIVLGEDASSKERTYKLKRTKGDIWSVAKERGWEVGD